RLRQRAQLVWLDPDPRLLSTMRPPQRPASTRGIGMRSPWWLVCVLCAASAIAPGKAPPVPEAEAGIGVEGTILVGPEGKALDYQLREPDALPEEVRRYLEYQTPRWEFEPPTLDGQPVALHNRMSLHLKAVPHADGGMRLQLHGTSFLPTQ